MSATTMAAHTQIEGLRFSSVQIGSWSSFPGVNRIGVFISAAGPEVFLWILLVQDFEGAIVRCSVH